MKDETYQASVTVVKRKKGVPTVIEVEGERYTLQHKDQYKRSGGSEKR